MPPLCPASPFPLGSVRWARATASRCSSGCRRQGTLCTCWTRRWVLQGTAGRQERIGWAAAHGFDVCLLPALEMVTKPEWCWSAPIQCLHSLLQPWLCSPAAFPPHPTLPQYRMHPDIREFPSLNFYGGNLKDGPNVAQVRHGRSLAAAAAASAAAVALVVWFVDPAGAACAAAAAGSPAPRLPACAPLYARAGPHQTHLLVGAGHQAGLARLPRLPAPCVHRRQGHGAQSCTWY